jgi:hypothetical protein
MSTRAFTVGTSDSAALQRVADTEKYSPIFLHFVGFDTGRHIPGCRRGWLRVPELRQNHNQMVPKHLRVAK